MGVVFVPLLPCGVFFRASVRTHFLDENLITQTLRGGDILGTFRKADFKTIYVDFHKLRPSLPG
jgi:hypothetical protein